MKVFHFLKLNGLTRAFLFGALLMLPIGAVLSGDSAAVLSAETTGTYYVSPDGSDSNDGLSSAKAFATPEKARDAIRLRRAQGETGAFQVNLSGVFLRSEPLLGPQDSDSSYVAKDGETSFSGELRLLTGALRPLTRSLRFQMPAPKSGAPNFRRLTVRPSILKSSS